MYLGCFFALKLQVAMCETIVQSIRSKHLEFVVTIRGSFFRQPFGNNTFSKKTHPQQTSDHSVAHFNPPSVANSVKY